MSQLPHQRAHCNKQPCPQLEIRLRHLTGRLDELGPGPLLHFLRELAAGAPLVPTLEAKLPRQLMLLNGRPPRAPASNFAGGAVPSHSASRSAPCGTRARSAVMKTAGWRKYSFPITNGDLTLIPRQGTERSRHRSRSNMGAT